MNIFPKNLVALCMVMAIPTAYAAPPLPASTATKPVAAKASPQSTAEGLFTRWDKDKNLSLSPEEFTAGWQEVETSMALRMLHENFVAKDTDKNGALDASEYANLDLVKKAGSAAPAIATFDSDKNQSLDFKEYVGMVNTTVKAQR